MHFIRIVAVTALAATGVFAFPLDSRRLVTADAITSPADNLVKGDLAFDGIDDKKYYVRPGLFPPDAEAIDPPRFVHVPRPISKDVKRAPNYDDDFVNLKVIDMNRFAFRPVVVPGDTPPSYSA